MKIQATVSILYVQYFRFHAFGMTLSLLQYLLLCFLPLYCRKGHAASYMCLSLVLSPSLAVAISPLSSGVDCRMACHKRQRCHGHAAMVSHPQELEGVFLKGYASDRSAYVALRSSIFGRGQSKEQEGPSLLQWVSSVAATQNNASKPHLKDDYKINPCTILKL